MRGVEVGFGECCGVYEGEEGDGKLVSIIVSKALDTVPASEIFTILLPYLAAPMFRRLRGDAMDLPGLRRSKCPHSVCLRY